MTLKESGERSNLRCLSPAQAQGGVCVSPPAQAPRLGHCCCFMRHAAVFRAWAPCSDDCPDPRTLRFRSASPLVCPPCCDTSFLSCRYSLHLFPAPNRLRVRQHNRKTEHIKWERGLRSASLCVGLRSQASHLFRFALWQCQTSRPEGETIIAFLGAIFAVLDDTYVVSAPERTGERHSALEDALWRHARIRSHQGKTRAWKRNPAALPASSRSVRTRSGQAHAFRSLTSEGCWSWE